MTNNTTFFTQENLAKLKEIMVVRKFAVGSYLFQEGDTADKLYLVQKGSVRTMKDSSEGSHLIIDIYEKNDLFGQIASFHEIKHTFSAKVIDAATIGLIQYSDLKVALWKNGDFALEFTEWMGFMHQLTRLKLRDFMMFGKLGALCSVLIRLNNMYGVVQGHETFIKKKHTHTELANMICASRESINRMLNDLKKNSVIAFENGNIRIKDLEYLRKMCHCENCPKEICRL